MLPAAVQGLSYQNLGPQPLIFSCSKELRGIKSQGLSAKVGEIVSWWRKTRLRVSWICICWCAFLFGMQVPMLKWMVGPRRQLELFFMLDHEFEPPYPSFLHVSLLVSANNLAQSRWLTHPKGSRRKLDSELALTQSIEKPGQWLPLEVQSVSPVLAPNHWSKSFTKWNEWEVRDLE